MNYYLKAMIKIRIPNEPAFRTNCVTAIKQPLLAKIDNLIIALDQSLGRNIRTGKGFQQFKGMARKVINTVRQDAIDDKSFNKGTFTSTVTGYRDDAVLNPVNLDGLFDLMTMLKANDGEELENLLLCSADTLYSKHQQLLNDNDLDENNEQEMDIIKLVFDYEGHNDIANDLRTEFRTINMVHYCPYCNQEKSMYTAGANNRTADVHQLDHFFDKASYPLLAFSLYNLVPGDSTCNAINKRDTPFSDIYHLNPYNRGFDNAAIFSAKIDDLDLKVTEVQILIHTNDPALRQQLIGVGPNVNDDADHGNINVFQLTGKYDRPDVREWATDKIDAVRKVANNLQNIQDILNEASLPDPVTRYATWYRKTMGARFNEAEFHLFPYSKFYRDLHDEVYRKRGGSESPELQAIIDARYIP